jgi:hypothetical protein
MINRSKDTGNDLATSWNSIPLNNAATGHMNQFAFSARATRVALGVSADISARYATQGYVEADFQGAAPTANSVSTNSYNPRLRHAWVNIDDKVWDASLLGGQTWSLLTLHKSGITPTSTVQPPTIDQQYLPGYFYARQAGVRLTKRFTGAGLTVAVAAENPQASFYAPSSGPTYPASLGTVTSTISASNFGGTTSVDVAPDLLAKIAWDPSFGHFEAFGLLRWIRDRVSVPGGGSNDATIAGGGGVGMFIPVVPKLIDFQGGAMVGAGIGRYTAGGLPDAIITASGAPKPIPEVAAYAGVVGHVTPDFDIYAFAGTEQQWRTDYQIGKTGYGLGSPLYTYTSCGTELGAGGACIGNDTSGLVQGTAGVTWRFLRGPWGALQAGLQYSHTNRNLFSGIGGTPRASLDMVLGQLRYTPFP